jgi:hypothetical protein
LRKASIDTTFVSPAASGGFSGFRDDFGAEAGLADGFIGVGFAGTGT